MRIARKPSMQAFQIASTSEDLRENARWLMVARKAELGLSVPDGAGDDPDHVIDVWVCAGIVRRLDGTEAIRTLPPREVSVAR
jgi:hypothetical protein